MKYHAESAMKVKTSESIQSMCCNVQDCVGKAPYLFSAISDRDSEGDRDSNAQ